MNKKGTINIIHWTFIKYKRVVHSVLVVKLYTMIHGFDLVIVIKAAINNMLKQPIPLIIYTDSKSFYNNLVLLNTITKKRFLIDLKVLYESYERRELVDVF